MACRFKVGKLAPLVAFLLACSSASNTKEDRPPPTCGNQLLEAGEQCDFPFVPSCAQALNNASLSGFTQCIGCQVSIASCQQGPNPGNGGFGGGGFPSNGGFAPNGGFPSNGGVPNNGGLTGQGGIPVMGGMPPFGGFPGTGGDLNTGGFVATGGDPGTGGFVATGGVPGTGGTSTGGNGNTGPLGDLNALRQTCLDTINQYRATMGLAPLSRASASVETCSDTGAQSDATTGRAHGSAGDCPGMSAQNTCPGWNPSRYGGTANALNACLQGMWNEGEPPVGRDQCIQDYFAGNTACFLAHGHYLNMSNSSYTAVSCGFYLMPDGRVWMNQDFGR
jgi:hypothetical protein